MTTATATRKYNPSTGRYELPDPWAGAPKGIRAMFGAVRHVYTDTDFYTSFPYDTYIGPAGTWNKGVGHKGIQGNLDAVRGGDAWSFPDFDGAPEGHRFYAKLGGAWYPRVELDGQVWLLDGWLWREAEFDLARKDYDNPGSKLFSHEGVVDVDERPKPKVEGVLDIQDRINRAYGNYPFNLTGPTSAEAMASYEKPWVDKYANGGLVHHYAHPGATERHFLNGWTASKPKLNHNPFGVENFTAPKREPEFQPGDVIRDLDNGTLWYANSSPSIEKVQSYQQIGARNLSEPTIVKAANWQKPKRYRVISKAVTS